MAQLERLRRSADFRRVFGSGRSVANRLAALYILPTGGGSRVGIAVGRRLGGAVVRNRTKRRWREVLRCEADRIRPGFDVVVVPRRGCLESGFQELRGGLRQLLARTRWAGDR
jgi:ribonuclease P protein component